MMIIIIFATDLATVSDIIIIIIVIIIIIIVHVIVIVMSLSLLLWRQSKQRGWANKLLPLKNKE